jgi:predicted transposase YbfD/YdcC
LEIGVEPVSNDLLEAHMDDFCGLAEHFSEIEDVRLDRGKKHKLVDILFIAVSCFLCGGRTFIDMEDCGNGMESWFRKYIELLGGIPSHDTFRRVFSLLSPEAFEVCFVKWTQTLHAMTDGQVIALDGKTIRHSFDTATDKRAIHIVSAWATENGLALGHVKVDGKSNEIKAIPKLLEMLDIKDRVVTIDALGCQKDIAKDIIEKKGDYVLCVKANQEFLHESLVRFFNEQEGIAGIEHTHWAGKERNRGRDEKRECWAVESTPDWLGFGEGWTGLRSIAAVKRVRTIKQEKSIEWRYYITSLPGDAKRIAKVVREHWGIENSLHYVLDVTMGEDESRARKDHSAANLATLRRIVVNICKRDKTPMKGVITIRRRMMSARWNQDNLERLLVT